MTAPSAKLRVPADSLGTLSELNSGGQGTVYELSDAMPALWALPYTDLVYKEYNRSARAALNPDVLEEMVRYAATLTSGPEGLGDRLGWPLATVERDGPVSGFLMRRAPQQFVVRLQLPRGEKWTLAEAQIVLNDEDFLADRQLPVHDRWRLQFLRDTADTLAQLHRSGIAVGDLSPKNLLVSFSTRPYCFFLDCDAMRIAGRSALPQVETTGWEIPNGEERATIASDAYKFALLAIRLFAGDQESKDVTALRAVHPPLGELAQLGISKDPSVRPAPADWLLALDVATPLATTKLPWEQAGGIVPPTRARISTPPRQVGQRGDLPVFGGEPSNEELNESVSRREIFVNKFLNQALRQADLAFYLSVIFLAAGGIIVLTAAVIILTQPHHAQVDLSAVFPGLIGLVIGTTGAAFSIRADKARKHLADQAGKIHDDLDRERYLRHSVKILADISDPQLSDEARVSLAKKLIDKVDQLYARERETRS